MGRSVSRILIALGLMLWATSVVSAPSVGPRLPTISLTTQTITFDATTADSPVVEVGGWCVANFTVAGSETVTLYAGTSSAGTNLTTFSASTVTDPFQWFAPPKSFVVAASNVGSTAGSTLVIECSKQNLSGFDPTAPGVAGNLATLETLQWIWGLERVPFPESIDAGQWTDYYFSAEASGSWPLGSDGNDGLTPETAKLTLEAAKSVCFGGAFRRCNFDTDDWTVANGGITTGFGRIENGDITVTGCPDPENIRHVLEQPCFWFRSASGGRAHWDATNTLSTAAFLDFTPTGQRAHMLIEAIDITGDSATANAGPPVDTHERGVMTVVASELVNEAVGTAGTNNVVTAHDVSVTHVYGNSNMSYTGDNSSGASAAFGANRSGNVAFHSSGKIEACTDNTLCAPMIFDTGTGNYVSTFEPEGEATPAGSFVSGAQLVSPNGSRGLRLEQDAASPSPADTRWYFVATSHEGGDYVFRNTDDVVTANNTAEIRFVYPTFKTPPDGERYGFQIGGTYDTSSLLHLHIAGGIWEYSSQYENTPFNAKPIIFFLSEGWQESASRLRLVDMVYDTVGLETQDTFRIDRDVGADCRTDSATLIEACVNATKVGPAIEVVNWIDITPDDSGTATAAAGSTLTDTGKSWTTNEWTGAIIRITGGDEVGQTRRVVSNTATVITVDTAWTTAPTDDPYSLEHYTSRVGSGYCSTEDDGECEGAVAGSVSDYSIPSLPTRLQIPSFIGGRRLIGFKGEPAKYTNLGRQRGEPWSVPTP